ncbi:hypothetical protein PINS_up005522 [Pythium insidiosum]|nr:hypothetical protein PINS_up005522 [Pythium insidiosum]
MASTEVAAPPAGVELERVHAAVPGDDPLVDAEGVASTSRDPCEDEADVVVDADHDHRDDGVQTSSKAGDSDVEAVDEKVRFEGYLRKRYSSSLYMGSWRYCVLQGAHMRWFMTHELAAQGGPLRGEIWITGVEPWSGQGAVNLYPHAFAVRTSTNRVVLCSAKSSAEKEQWITALQRCVTLEKNARRNARPHDAHGPDTAERRRIVPEDAVRAATAAHPPPPLSIAVSDLTGGQSAPTSSNLDSANSPSMTSPRQFPSPSMVSTISDTYSVDRSPRRSRECARCGVRFGSIMTRRVVCGSCDVSFCSRHCRRYIKLHHLPGRPMRKCCATCVRREEFVLYLGAVTEFMKTLATKPLGLRALTARKTDQPMTPHEAELYKRTMHKLREGPMSLVKTIKILYQTRQKPHLFCAACERLPFYVENCIDRVENLWYQILHLVQCCDTEFDSYSVQLFCLKRVIAAICRRSPRIALQTIWHVQAALEDSSRHHPNSLLSLLGFMYTPSRDSKVWNELLLVNCPDHQRESIIDRLVVLHEANERVIAREPDSLLERWLRAETVTEFESCATELRHSGIELCDFHSSINYESLRVEDSEGGERNGHLQGIVADQVRFVQSLAAMSERLRHIQPVENRSSQLSVELKKLNDNLIDTALYPMCAASDELFKVVRIPPNDGKVFSTKMRAPTLIFIETIPVDATMFSPGSNVERLLPFISSRRGNLTLLEEVDPEEKSGQQRESLVSSNASSMGTVSGATSNQRRHGSQLSAPEDLDIMGGDDVISTPGSDASACNDAACRHMTFPGDMPNSRPSSSHTNPSIGFSIGGSLNEGGGRNFAAENLVFDSKVFGESWEERKERIRRESPHGDSLGWQLFSVIVKTNDDLRQEVFTMQLLNKFKSVFEFEELDLWLRTYRIVATGANIGLLETINDACSIDHLKKSYQGGNLSDYFRSTFGDATSAEFESAQRNFIRSMAAYSIVTYVLLVKDRHNGNILLTSDGHIIHIDFGFILGIAPGGMLSIEDAPFKLTTEMVEVMGGLHSPGFALYRQLMCDGFAALQKYQSEIAALLQTTGQHSPFPCFAGAKLTRMVSDLRGRLCVGLSMRQIEKRVDHLINKSFNARGTRYYDAFQKRSNNIHA